MVLSLKNTTFGLLVYVEKRTFLLNRSRFVTAYKYKYNGKEYQDELGLNMYAMDMRQYDPAIGRWVVQDPIVHHSQSPYCGFDNNPVFFADPSGADSMNSNLFGFDQEGKSKTNSMGLFIPKYERDAISSEDGGTNYLGSDIVGAGRGNDPSGNDTVPVDSPIYKFLRAIGIDDPNSEAPRDIESIKKILTSPDIMLLVKDAKYTLEVDLVIYLADKNSYGETFIKDGETVMKSYMYFQAFNTWARLALTITHEASHKIDYLTKSWNVHKNESKYASKKDNFAIQLSHARTEHKAWSRSASLGDPIGSWMAGQYEHQANILSNLLKEMNN